MEKITTVLAGIQSRLVAPKDLNNSFGNYKYRSCEGILNALKPLLAEACAVVTMSDDIVEVAGRIYVKATATLICAGESIAVVAYAREAMAKKGMDDAQVTGSASSYARKYALNGLFAIDDTKDADHPAPQQQRPQAPPPKKTRTTAERVAGACKAYGECNDAATMVGLGKHLDALMEDCDDDQKKMLSSVYNAAVERANEGAK